MLAEEGKKNNKNPKIFLERSLQKAPSHSRQSVFSKRNLVEWLNLMHAYTLHIHNSLHSPQKEKENLLLSF